LMIYPLRDQIGQAGRLSERWTFFIAFLLIISLSTVYELLEWAAAEVISTQDSFVFVGAQGDIFDAQKDIALAIGGALVGTGISKLLTRGRLPRHS
jgi:putative membrane protein